MACPAQPPLILSSSALRGRVTIRSWSGACCSAPEARMERSRMPRAIPQRKSLFSLSDDIQESLRVADGPLDPGPGSRNDLGYQEGSLRDRERHFQSFRPGGDEPKTGVVALLSYNDHQAVAMVPACFEPLGDEFRPDAFIWELRGKRQRRQGQGQFFREDRDGGRDPNPAEKHMSSKSAFTFGD